MSRLSLKLLFAGLFLLPALAYAQPAVDSLGDPLPPGAVARLGTARLTMEGYGLIDFLPDGNTVVSSSEDAASCWEVANGKLVKEVDKGSLPRLAHETRYRVRKNEDESHDIVEIARQKTIRTITADELKLPKDQRWWVCTAWNGPWAFVHHSAQGEFRSHHLKLISLTSRKWVGCRIEGDQEYGFEAADVAPDGKTFATLEATSAGEKMRVQVRDTATGKPLHTHVLVPDKSPRFLRRFANTRLQYHPDANIFFVVEDWHDTLFVCAADTGKPLRQRQLDEPLVKELGSHASYDLAPDGRRIAWLGDQKYQVWETKSGKVLKKGQAERTFADVHANMVLSPDGWTVALGERNRIALIDLRTGKEMLPGLREPVEAIAFAPDSKSVATASFASPVHLWDAGRGTLLRTFSPSLGNQRPTGRPQCGIYANEAIDLTFADGGKKLAAAWTQAGGFVWDVATGKELRHLPQTDDQARLAFSRDGRKFAAITQGSSLELLDSFTGRKRATLAKPEETNIIRAMVFTPDSKDIVLAGLKLSEEKIGLQLSLSAPSKKQPWRTLPASLQAKDKDKRFWELFSLFEATRCRLAVAPGARLAALGAHQTIYVLDLTNGKALHQWSGAQLNAATLQFSPDGRFVLAGQWDGSIALWNLATGKKAVPIQAHDRAITALQHSPDGKLLATASADMTVLLWDWPALPRSVAGKRME